MKDRIEMNGQMANEWGRYVIPLEKLSKLNKNFRTALWTGEDMQLTVMSIPPRTDIGREIHENFEQMLYITEGTGLLRMGDEDGGMRYTRRLTVGDSVIVPRFTLHNIINIGSIPLKLFSVYAPPAHPKGTVHKTKEDAMEE